jgi:pyruvate formate lyase activating enzyme
MRIGGFLSFTLLDFPGRVAAVVFTQGCNYRCPYCHNRELIPLQPESDRMLPETEVRRQIEMYSDRLDGIVVSGGEPTLQPDLADLLVWVRSLGLETKLDTNGSRPQVLVDLLAARLLSYVAMDIKAPPAKYEELAGAKDPVGNVLESIQVIAQSGVEHEFRTTLDESLLSSRDLEQIKGLVPPESPFRVQKARHPRIGYQV